MRELRECASGCPSKRNCLGLGPRAGRELLDLGDLGRREAREQILQILERVDALPPTTAQQGVDHRAALARGGMPDEEPILLAEGTGANGILYAEMPVMPRSGYAGW